jgi:ATP:ADP antiporter, AAA family
MNMQRSVARYFKIKRGEEKVILPLLLYSIFMGIAYAFLFTTATSLFLADFKTRFLPFAYIAGGLLNYFLWLIYSRFEHNLLFSRKLLFGGVFLLLTITFLAWAYNQTGLRLFSFLLFIWINVFLFINGVGFWGVAGKLFNLQQGKRLFGLISSGEVFAKMLGFFSVPFLLTFLKNTQILYFSVVGLIGCLALIVVITHRFGGQLDTRISKAVTPEPEKINFWSTIRNKYYRFILILAVFPLFGAYFIDYIFLDQTKDQFENPQLVSSFLGVIFGFMSVAEFVIKTFISGRLISKYGILLTLMALPVMLFFTTFSASFTSTLMGFTTLFFTFVCLNKLAVRVLRTSFLDPAFQILYQPIPRDERQILQGKVEGISKSAGNFLAGGLLIFLAHAPVLNIIHFHFILLVIVGLWIWISYILYQEYRTILTNILARIKETEAPKAGSRLSDYFALCDLHNPNRFSLAIHLIEKLDPGVINYLLLRLMPKAPPAIQLTILETISRKKIVPAFKILQFCLENNLLEQQEEKAQAVQQELTAASQIHITELLALVNSPEVTKRIEAAEIVAYYNNYFTYNILLNLISDADSRVRNIVLPALGRRKHRDLWPMVLKNLSDAGSFFPAMCAIQSIGETMVTSLIEYFKKDKTDKLTQTRILFLLAELGGARSIRFLWEKAYLFEDEVRNNVLRGLMNLQFKVPSLQKAQLKQAIENDVASLVWIAACLQDLKGREQVRNLVQALESEANQKQENVFMQLSLLYDSQTIEYFIKSFKSASEENRAYALEVLDLTVSQDIKELILPLLDNAGIEDLLKQYEARFPQQKLSYPQRLQDIINKDYLRVHKWTKCCALEAATGFPETALTVAANFLNPEPMIAETALWVYYNQDPGALQEVLQNFKIAIKIHLQSVVDTFDKIKEKQFLRLQVAKILKIIDLFDGVPVFDLVKIAENSRQLFLPLNQEYSPAGEYKSNIFIVLKGEISLRQQSGYNQNLTTLDSYWYLEGDPDPELAFLPVQDTVLLEIPANLLLEILSKQKHLTAGVINMLSIKRSDLEWAA